MNTKEYFEKRALQTEKHSKDRGEKYLEELKKSYEEIEKQIQNDIDAWHKKYADADESISNINARKPLNHEELKEYLENIKNKIENSNLSDEDKQELKQGYLSSRLNRLESLLKQTELNLKILTRDYENSSKEHLTENYKQSYSEAAHSLYDCPTVNFDLSFDRFDNRAIEQIVNAKWSNKNFSERIWGHYSNMANDLQGILNVGIALGYSVDKMSRQVRDRMDVNFSNAKRLIRTESNYILSEATQQLYKDVGLEKYQFLATLDFRTSEICQSLDGKVFEVNKRQIGLNCNPMHPNCRSTTIPYLEEYQDEDDTRLARDMDGKNYKVPANMNYKAWYESMSEKEKGKYKINRKMMLNRSNDEKEYEKYRLIYGDQIGKSLEEFQKMKYSDDEKWVKYKEERQEKLNTLDYRDEFFGKFGDLEVRRWYKAHDENILNIIDTTKSIKEQAMQAHALRNKYRSEARLMMSDREKAEELNANRPNKSFEELVEYKMSKKNLSLEEAYKDIIETAGKTNKEVNKKFNLD